MTDTRFHTAAGRLTAYAFACGYIERLGTLTLGREHNVYHVKGIAPLTGVHVWETYRTLTEARQQLRTLWNIHGDARGIRIVA